MRNSLRALALLVALLSLARAAAAQGVAVRQQLVVPLTAGTGFVGFRLETTLDGAQGTSQNFAEVQAALMPQALLDEGNTVHRVVMDRAGNVVFGYDLIVEATDEPHRFRVTARPLGANFERTLRARRTSVSQNTPSANGAAGTQASQVIPTLAREAAPQLLEDGDTVELDLLVNPKTGVRVVDVIRVATDRARLWQAQPRDFTLDSVEIAVSDPRLVVNGAMLQSVRAQRSVSGALVWFYVPGRGRFVLSLVPRAGYDFRKIGLIEGNRASFDFRGEHFEWVSSTPLVGSGGDWFAWVLFDPNYTPEVTNAEEIARDAQKPGDAQEPGALKQILNGETPRAEPTTHTGFDQKKADAAKRGAQLRVRFGAANSIESLLPKR
jgi:hypothetical protein